MDISTIERYDLQKMYKIYDNWPELARKQYEEEKEKENFHM